MLKDMKSYNHLKPGQKGTKRLVEQYGDALLCVRYRYDERRGIRLKTVEIVVEERPFTPSRFKDGDIVSVSVNIDEMELLTKFHFIWDLKCTNVYRIIARDNGPWRNIGK